jgi:hypothetical protein
MNQFWQRHLVIVAILILTANLGLSLAAAAAGEGQVVQVVPAVAAQEGEGFYAANRAPLAPSRLIKLPIGAITPKGWLRHQLELERDGMIGHLDEISPWCKFQGNAWGDPHGRGKNGWEELPYWLKGYGDLGYVLKDEAIIRHTHRWLEGMLASQEPDGWFGPRDLKKGDGGTFGGQLKRADMWPMMLALNCLQSYYEQSGDRRVLDCMSRYFRWQLDYPEARFLSDWADVRKGDNLESVYWLYNRTGEPWLLDLAKKIHRRGSDWTGVGYNGHGVNFSQGFREPGEYALQGGPKFLQATERQYQTVMGIYGQFPGGGFAADENMRPGFVDPRQGFETCSWVEFMHSFEMLAKMSGQPLWADRCEEIAFNSLPAAQMPDLKGLHYLTGANMVQLDHRDKSPDIQNGGDMLSYNPWEYRCCQHNVSHGWPYYAEELWLATGDRGLCASLYAASEVTAKVGDGTAVTVAETTDYPFADGVELKLATARSVRFPLYLRIPRWCRGAAVRINGQEASLAAEPLSYVRIERQWAAGDTVSLRLPMTLGVRTWTKNHDSVSVDYGPLTFSLEIGEKWVRRGGSDKWPAFEVFPTTPWNYGLVLDQNDPAGSFELVRRPGPLAAQPFTPQSVPIRLQAKARRIPRWILNGKGLIGALQASPAWSDEPLETVTLIPMGAARLRVSAFPTASSAPDAHHWVETPDFRASASFAPEADSTDALNNGSKPARSNDQKIPRFVWWPHSGTAEWVQYDFVPARKVSAVEVYWFDDTGTGGCRVPASWQLLYKDGQDWKPVEAASGYGTKTDRFNRTAFRPVQTRGLRIAVQLQPGFSGGILQWKLVE